MTTININVPLPLPVNFEKQNEYQNTMNKMNTLITPQNIQHQLNEQTNIIQQLIKY
jgi:hypothetical protein